MARAPLPMDPIAEARRQWLAHGWADAADGMTAVTSLIRAQQIVLARVETALKPFGLSFARYELLQLLNFSHDRALPMASASARLQVHPTSVTNVVDRLEQDGLVRRTAHPTDRRATLVLLTDDGAARVGRATATLNRDVFAALGIPPAQLRDLVQTIARFRREAGDFVDPPELPEPL
ncbi:MarR family winged helix-turn-helix transcriptional regulator [Specibacter cremeus]|uniref:MarR family winged helix-turn-helix transcriptional regulator n=1 Tax=Specibacter cremeus TaxID=1629051 RepID=UPI001F0C97EC|nr:MarR family transcriptional regulator [Specibacter cremeus]